MPVQTLDDALLAGQMILSRGAANALITLGARGALLVNSEMSEHIPSPAVTAVDTTGAGDAFVGSLTHYLAAGATLRDAIAHANQIAAISVQAPGTQASYPRMRQ